MADRADITPELCRQLLRYEPETGKLFWRERALNTFTDRRAGLSWNSRYSGKRALAHINHNGYLSGRIMNVPVLSHRVIWLMTAGRWPAKSIDHIDGNRTNNRLSNLREADHILNAQNQRLRSGSKTGVMGVCWNSHAKKWMAQISANRMAFHLGYFDRIEDAIAARRDAEVRLGFHPNHGR